MQSRGSSELRSKRCTEILETIEALKELRETETDPDLIKRINERIHELETEYQEKCVEPKKKILQISGVEQTQATQFFRSELNPCPDRSGRSGPCPDNDIPLAGRKTTVLRVYPHYPARDPPPSIDSITGKLETRHEGRDRWHSPVEPFNGPISPRRAGDIDRGDPDHTLNFRIPAIRCRGNLQARLRIFDSQRPGNESVTSGYHHRTLTFMEPSTLDIRLVRIRYENDDRADGPFDVPAPTMSEFWQTARFTNETYPIRGIRVVRDSVELYDGDFTSFFASGGDDAQGSTGTIFEILTDLRDTEDLESDVQYLALIPGSPANQTGHSGWAITQRNISEVFEDTTMAQELGHNCVGSEHAPCGNPPNPDPDYPDYGDGAYPAASIGEFGFDTASGTVHDPTATHDFMSYCGPNWVSPYMYERLFGCFGQTQTAGEADVPEQKRELRERLYLTVAIDRDGRVTSTGPGVQLPGRPLPQIGSPTPYFVELRTQSGAIVESQRLRQSDFHKSLDDAHLDFFIDLAWHDDAARIVFTREGEVLDELEIAPESPEVEMEALAPAGQRLADEHTIKWTYPAETESVPDGAGSTPDDAGSIPDEEGSTQHLRYSNDGGTTWYTIARNVSGTEYRIDPDELPGGSECRFQVVASRGYRTSVATSGVFEVSRKPHIPFIIAPEEGATFEEGDSVPLFGVSRSSVSTGDEDTLQWSSSIDGFLGSGGRLVPHTLSAGTHGITLDTEDSYDNDASASVTITVQRAQ